MVSTTATSTVSVGTSSVKTLAASTAGTSEALGGQKNGKASEMTDGRYKIPQKLTWNLEMMGKPIGISFSKGPFSGSMFVLGGVRSLK